MLSSSLLNEIDRVKVHYDDNRDVECFGVPVAVRDEINRHESQGKVLDYYSENPPKVFLRLCLNVSRFMCAIEVVRGMSFGQTRTQFCAVPHEVMPSAPIMAERRTSLFMAPVG